MNTRTRQKCKITIKRRSPLLMGIVSDKRYKKIIILEPEEESRYREKYGDQIQFHLIKNNWIEKEAAKTSQKKVIRETDALMLLHLL